MQKTKIDWGYGPEFYTWNPVTGCRRGCAYCYAKKLWDFRFKKKYEKEFTEIIWHDKEAFAPMKRKKPAIIFVGSMSDHEYWAPFIKDAVLTHVECCPQHTFMFLSKNPIAYSGYVWPQNTMQGLTLTCEQDKDTQHGLILKMLTQNTPRNFLSLEPLLGKLYFHLGEFERVIIGAMTGHKAVAPNPEWIQSVKDNVPEDKIFWKPNIRKYL